MARKRDPSAGTATLDVSVLREAVAGGRSFSAVVRALGLPVNGTWLRRVRAACAAHQIDTAALTGRPGALPETLDRDAVRAAVAHGRSMREVLSMLGRPAQRKWADRVRAVAIECGYPLDHLTVSAVRRTHGFARSRYTPTAELFSQGKRRGGVNFRHRMMRDLGVPYACYRCGNTGSWCGEPLTLAVDHANGDRSDNRTENLRFACPNCHTQTPTWGRKKRSVREPVPEPYAAHDRVARRPVSSAGSRTAPRRRAARRPRNS